jgi:hypothetical protein
MDAMVARLYSPRAKAAPMPPPRVVRLGYKTTGMGFEEIWVPIKRAPDAVRTRLDTVLACSQLPSSLSCYHCNVFQSSSV